MKNTKINEIQKRPITDGVELDSVQKEILKAMRGNIKYRHINENQQLMPARALLIIEAHKNKESVVLDQIKAIIDGVKYNDYSKEELQNILKEELQNSFHYGRLELEGKKAKDFATILARNGIDFEGKELLQENNMGGVRTI